MRRSCEVKTMRTSHQICNDIQKMYLQLEKIKVWKNVTIEVNTFTLNFDA